MKLKNKFRRMLAGAAACLMAGAVCCAALPAKAFAAEDLPTLLRRTWNSMSSTAISVKEYGLSLEDFTAAYYGALYTDADRFYVAATFSYALSNDKNKIVTSVLPQYNYEASEVPAMQKELDAKVKEITGQCQAEWTDAEKILFFHDYLASHCAYDMTFSGYDAYTALIGGKAVCQGYSFAMCILCREIGLECYAVASDKLGHMWNVVEAEGAWYQVDITYDDAAPNMIGMSSHEYLFFSDADMAADSYHATDDLIYFTGGKTIVCESDAYDNAFWSGAIDAVTPMPDGSWIYTLQYDPATYKGSSSIGATLVRGRFGSSPEPIYAYKTYWTAPGNRIYTSCYSVAEVYGDRIYFTKSDEICSVALDGSDLQTLHTLTAAEKANGSIFGMTIDENGLLTYQVMPQASFLDEDYTTGEVHYTIQLEKLPVVTTTAPAPITTTPAPVTTTPAPVTTTPAPVTTTPAPVTTTPAPVTTTPAPVTTTPAPVTTTTAASELPAQTTTTTPVIVIRAGDVDLDGDVTLKDAVLLAKAVGGMDIKLTLAARCNADCVQDGDINEADLIWLLRWIVGLIELPTKS